MGGVNVHEEQRAAAYQAAVAMAREHVLSEPGWRNVKLSSFSDAEWDRLANAIVAGWIVARSKQLAGERLDEAMLLATGEVPEPAEIGLCELALPALGELVEKLQLSDVPIGNWKKDQVLLFVWTCAELVGDIRVRRDERPSSPELAEVSLMLAG